MTSPRMRTARPGPGEGLALQDFFGHAQVAADFADFVFEQFFERLDQLELHLLGQAADVVMRLDDLRRAAHGARFDHVGIKRALHQPFDFAFFFLDAMGFFVEDGDEFVADDFALCFGIGHAGEFG